MRYFLPSLLLLLASPVTAQQNSHHCATVPEAAARLLCYDRAYPPSPEVLEAATARARADFGLSTPRDPLRNAGQAGGEEAPERIESRVIKVDYGRGGQRNFTLENGQVWMQTEARSSGHVRVDERVEVRTGIMGGYQLITAAGVALRVRRAR
ncbi:MAG: hypothetical protein ABW163_13520 [Luteimonas sp.]